MDACNDKTQISFVDFATLLRDYWPMADQAPIAKITTPLFRAKVCQKNSEHYRGNLEILYIIKI